VRDCSSCKHSVDKRPELREIPFEETPCYKCRPSNPERLWNVYSYEQDHFDAPSYKTAKVLEIVTDEPYRTLTYDYMRYLRMPENHRRRARLWIGLNGRSPLGTIIGKFSRLEESMLARCAEKDWQFTQSEIAREMSVSRQYVHKVINKVGEIAPIIRKVMKGGDK
jgi:hypothetical protein